MTRAPAVILVAIAIAGCGNDGYVVKADAICATANKKEAAAGAPGPGWIYQAEFDDAEFLEKFNAPGHEVVRKLRALQPAAAQRDRAAAMVAAIEEMVEALDGRIADLKAGKGDASARIKAYLAGYSDLTPVAAVLGVSECQGVSL